MSHYDLTQWADFVRGIGGEAERRQMEQHLASGCRTCGGNARLMGSLRNLATSEAACEVPRDAEQSVRAMFLLRQPERVRRLPRLAAKLVFSDAVAGPQGPASEMLDLDQSPSALLDANPSGLDTSAAVNQSTSAILDQSPSSLQDRTTLPATFGHGTMVAGIVHLVAPEASIMPLKAFRANGVSNTFDIIRAIYYAVEHGAKVINMSFSLAGYSGELLRALEFATDSGVICVASAGNDGKREPLIYPASAPNVMAVAASNDFDVRSWFSNYGEDLIHVAAPGEGIITTFPGGRYAAAWGTSFSAPFVTGAAALLVQVDPGTNQYRAADDLSHAARLTDELGHGRLDLYEGVVKRHDD